MIWFPRRVCLILLLAICMIASAPVFATVEYMHTDALGTPVAVTDADGNVLQTSEYEPYGKLLNRPRTDGPAYTGHVTDAATGLTYMQQRYYDPGIGRFLSVDPVTADGSGGNFNRYQYASDNPYRFTDPDGRRYKPWTPCNACGEARGPVGAGGTAPGNQAAEANFGAFASKGNNKSPSVTAGPAVPAPDSPSSNKPIPTVPSSSPAVAIDVADVALTAQGILSSTKQGGFVSSEGGISHWEGATLKAARIARQFETLGTMVSLVSIGTNSYGFYSAYQSGDGVGMVRNGVGTAFGVGGLFKFGAPGAFTYGLTSLLLQNPTIHSHTITPMLDLVCSGSGNC